MRFAVIVALALGLFGGAVQAQTNMEDSASRMSTNNICMNGDFEQLQEAAARPLPQGWAENRSGDEGLIEMSKDAFSGKRSLRLAVRNGFSVGMNSEPIPVGRGLVRFHYKIMKSDVEGANLCMFVIALNKSNGTEVMRQGFYPPKEHVGDGQWHEGTMEFDFASQGIHNCLIALRINENTPRSGDGDWLIDDMAVYAIHSGAEPRLVHTWSDKPLARTGDTIKFSAWLENHGDKDAADIQVRLEASDGVKVVEPIKTVSRLGLDSFERVDWTLKAEKPVRAELKVSVDGVGDTATYKILVIDRAAKYTRQELCTDEMGYWRLLDRPTTLQEGNAAGLITVKHKKSSEIKRNPYGICAHLPRAKDYEEPFNPLHLIDGDPDTCWSSQQNSKIYPGDAHWAEIDLGRKTSVKQINLIPYWRNTSFPVAFSVRTSVDGKTWKTVLQVKNHQLSDMGSLRGDKMAQLFSLAEAVDARYVHVDFEKLPLADGTYCEVSQGYKARLSGIEVVDSGGQNVALESLGAKVEVSDVFTGWQNTAKTVNESFPRVFELGLKWVRVGQWGDQTEWAAVEREKGKFEMDPVTDRAIQTCADNGVDILYGLNYGNALYNDMDAPYLDIGPIFTEGHPFYKHCGPKTEEQRQAFVRYVDYVVRRYKDRVKWWELWNEENGWYPGFEPELYGKLLHAVAKHIKSIDPGLKVMFGGTAAPAPITTEISLREGAVPYLDATAFHPYGINKPEGGMGTMEAYQGKNLSQTPEQTGWKCLEDIIEGVRKPFAQHGKPNVEVWLNEWGTNLTSLGFSYDPVVGEYGSAKYLMRFYIYSGWLGSPTAWWALYNLNKSQDWGIFDQRDYGFRPVSYALQNVCSVVSDVEPIRKLDYKYEGSAPDPKVIGYKRDGSDETLVLVWGAEQSNEEIKSYPSKLRFAIESRPAKVELTDIYWGVSQPAVWSYDNGYVTVERLIVRDYPVVVSCK